MATTGDDDRGDPAWVDEDAGPLVRSYTLTRGRTTGTRYDLSALVSVRRGVHLSPSLRLGPEHLRILDLCAARPLALAELSAVLGWPLTAIRVLVDDLGERQLATVTDPSATAAPGTTGRFSRRTLEQILDGLTRL